MQIPCALTSGERALLGDLARDKRVYEAGSLLGGSALCMLNAGCKSLVSVDPHSGYPRHAPRDTFEQFLFNTRSFTDRLVTHRALFNEVSIDQSIDLVFADLTGEFELTKLLLEQSKETRIVAIHDFQRLNCHGGTDAVEQFIKNYNRRLNVSRVDTLIVLEKW